jgi:hypothetical protein
MLDQRLQLTYFFVKDDLPGIPPRDWFIETGFLSLRRASIQHAPKNLLFSLAAPQGPPYSEE